MKYYLPFFVKCLCYLFCHSLVYNCDAQAPQPVLCFDFSGDLNATNSIAAMSPIDGLGVFSEGQSICNVDSTYSWEISTGLRLQDPVNYFPQDHYTIELLFKFTSQPYPSSYQKIIDFKNRTSDRGLYLLNNNLNMYTQYTGTSGIAQPDTWFRLFLTRDRATDSIKGYINNSLEIELEDDLGDGIFTDFLILFKDDIAVSGEESAGEIGYMKVYDYPLSAVEINALISIPIVRISGDISACPGDSLVLQANGADSYLWNTGETTPTITVHPSVQDTIKLTGYLNLGCMESCLSEPDTVILSEYNVIKVNLGADVESCPGEQVVLDAGNNYISYNWTGGSVAQTLAVSDAMQYWVSVLDSNSCLSSDTIILSEYNVIKVNLGADVESCPGEQVVLDAGNNYISYNWTGGSVAQTLVVLDSMQYWVSVVDSNSCLSSDTINLFVGLQCEPPEIEVDKNVFVPNTFTPNTDGLNDFFKIKMEGVKDMNLLIFNRWGNLLYETNTKTANWDGTYKGVKVSSGTYVYVLSVVFNDGSEITRKGHVNLFY